MKSTQSEGGRGAGHEASGAGRSPVIGAHLAGCGKEGGFLLGAVEADRRPLRE